MSEGTKTNQMAAETAAVMEAIKLATLDWPFLISESSP